MSSRSGLLVVWRLARATSTQPAPTSKPAGFPPCDTLRWVGPRTPPPSLKWRSGSKPWPHLTLPHLTHHPPHSRCLHQNAANDTTPPHPHLYYLLPLLLHTRHSLPLHHTAAAAPAFKPLSLPLRPHHHRVFAGCITGSRHLRVTRSFISSCSSASVHSLPCGPRIAVEKESGFPTPSRFKSAGAGEYTGDHLSQVGG